MRRPTASSFAPLGAATLLVLAAACGSSGRELRPPESNAVSPTRSTTAGGAAASSSSQAPSAARMNLTSTAFTPAGAIPARFGCDGPSPPLAWSNVPAGTAELALVVVDLDANATVHWLVTGITAADGSVAEGAVPAGGTALANSSGSTGWSAPCPPPGELHTYNFVLLALTERSSVAAGDTATDVYAQLQQAAGGNAAILTGTFQRQG